VEQHDRVDLRGGLVDRPELLVVSTFLRVNAIVGDAPEQLGDVQYGEIDRLEHFRGVLVYDVERTLDPLVPRLLCRVLIDPGRIREPPHRQDDRAGDRQIQEPQCCALCCPHDRCRMAASLAQLCRRRMEGPGARTAASGAIAPTKLPTSQSICAWPDLALVETLCCR